jgi:hypothetical protein
MTAGPFGNAVHSFEAKLKAVDLSMTAATTRFAHFSRPAARAALAAALTLAAAGIVTSHWMGQWALGHQGAYDLEFYEYIVEKMHSGDHFYDACEDGFAHFGFTARSMFNWRQPTLASIISSAPNPEWFHWLLLGLSLLSVLAAIRTFVLPCGMTRMIFAVLLLLGGAFSWNIYEPQAFEASEPWCEVFILFSLCAYARGWWKAGMAAALAGLALRELMLPYCLVAATLAAWRKRWWEVLLWSVFLALYVFLLNLHGREIARRRPEAPLTSVADWMQPSGLRFVLQTSCMNLFLRPLPPFIQAIYVPVALIGLAGWKGEIGARLLLSAIVYAVSFTLINASEYWGYMYASIMALGAIRSPEALRDLWIAATTTKQGP